MKATKILSYLLLGWLLSGLVGCAQKVERTDGYYAPLGTNTYPIENSYYNYNTAPMPYSTTQSSKKRKAKSSSSKSSASSKTTKSSAKVKSFAATSSGAVYHTVKKGENLYRIALRYGVSQAAIRSANGLGSNSIRPGQKLLIPGARSSSEDVTTPTKRAIASVVAVTTPTKVVSVGSSTSLTCSPIPKWGWPSQGTVAQTTVSKGVAIKITGGAQTLKSAAAGTVTFAGRGTNRTNRITINHNRSFSTVYEYDGKLNIKIGDSVKLGTAIGQLSAQSPLYFEIRCHQKALNPLTYLPS